MNPNDILAQQQALMNQATHNSQQIIWGMVLIQVALFVLTAWMVYMFYARLREIADELRKLRIAYESAHLPTKSQPMHRSQAPPMDDDSRYQPKK